MREGEHGWSQRRSGLVVPAGDGGEPDGDRSDVPERIQEWATRIGTVAAAVAGLVIVVHVLGGTVMWLRFNKAGLPADQAVALMTREQMLTVGLRLMVLPALATGLLALGLVWARGRRPGELVRGGRIALRIGLVLVAILFLSLPMSWASLTWLGLGLVILYWWRGFGIERRTPGRSPSPWRLAAVAVLAAAIISLGRQIDEPVQLLSVEVKLDRRPIPVKGTFVSVDANALYVGDTEENKIEGFRRADVRSVALGPPLERAPNRSILSALLSDDRWAITPLRWWCNGERYSWFELGRLCRTQPAPLAQRRALDVRWIPVRIRCPREARERCEGHLRLSTVRTYSRALGPEAVPQHVSFPRRGSRPVAFTLPAGRTREFCVETKPDERALLRAVPDGLDEAEQPVRLQVVLSGDTRGDSVLTKDATSYRLDIAPSGADPSLIPVSDCSRAHRAGLAAGRGRAATATADGVEDGDTIIVRLQGARVRVQLLGLSAPASPSFGRFACGQREGIDFLLRRLFAEPVDSNGDDLADRPGGAARTLRLRPDPGRGDRDDRSRLLRHVTVAGADATLQEQLLRAGWARLDAGRGARLADLAAYERAARAGGATNLGLHAVC